MPAGANVTSVEALEAFRANLIVYISKARPTLEEVSSEVLRTRLWLENDQRLHWEAQVRRRAKELESARQDLFSAGLSNLRDTTAAEIMAVRRAEKALEHAENKLAAVKRWSREFESRTAPVAKQLEKLETILANDLPAAAAYLGQTIKTLEQYASGAPASTSSDVPASPKTESSEPQPGGEPPVSPSVP